MNPQTASLPAARERKIKGRVDINIERCKGCELCTVTCKEQALSLSSTVNSKGYRFIVADNERCTGCVNCAFICPDGVIAVYRTLPPKRQLEKRSNDMEAQVNALINLL